MDKLCVDNLRLLSMYQIEKANSGHPGVALSAAPIFYSLYANHMLYNTDDDKWIFRDRFVCSAGHASSLLYSTLHLFGFDINIDDLKNFRQLNSKTPGHPEIETCGVDCSTGPLGQGVSNAVGMAIAAKHFASVFNKPDIKLFDNKIYCFVGDGCLMEGISYEATSLAGNLNLDNLILIYDCNKRTIDGNVDITWNEDIKKRFEAINFECFEVQDGNDVLEISNAITSAKNCGKPSIVVVNTKLGYGSIYEDKSSVHGKPLTIEEIELLKKKLNISVDSFEVLPQVNEYIKNIQNQVKQKVNDKKSQIESYKNKYENDYQKLISYLNFSQNNSAIKDIENCTADTLKSMRDVNFEIFNSFNLDNFIGGSADVENSTKVIKKYDEVLSSKNYGGKKIYYGIREHAMAGVSNGLCLFGGIMSYCSLFMTFVDYLKPSMRMSALMNLPVLYVLTHDNVLIGEDGPTHQPIEQLAMLRITPNLNVFRAYNDDEIKACYINFLTTKKPTVLIVSRSKINMQKTSVTDALKGGYEINKVEDDNKIILVSSGSDVETSLSASKILKQKGINCQVVSMPSVEVFESQSKAYQNSIIDKKYKVFTFESASSLGLLKFVDKGKSFGVDTFGKSGKASDIASSFEITPEHIAKKILENLKISE